MDSGKVGSISYKTCWCHKQNWLFNFMVSYLHSFNPCMSINENGKYSSYKGKRIRKETIYFNFRLVIGVHNFNHINEFVYITRLATSRINLRRTHLWRRFKDIKLRLLFNLFETLVTSWIVENMSSAVLFLIASDWFSPIIASKTFCLWFLRIVV